MPRFQILVTCALLAACTATQDPSRLEANIVHPGNFIKGSGVIESVGAVAGSPGVFRIYLRMDIGGFQAVEIDKSTFLAGEAVDLTNDGRMVRVTGTSLNDALRNAR